MKKVSENRKIQKEFDSIAFAKAGSINDCTGLIPKAVEDNHEYESYKAICNFSASQKTDK